MNNEELETTSSPPDLQPDPATYASDTLEPVPQPDPQQSSVGGTAALLLEQLNRIEGQMEEHERLSEQRARIIDRLHEENQQLKQGELTQALAPIYRDLMRLYDDLNKSARAYSAQDLSQNPIPGRDPAREWRFYAETLEEILNRYGVNTIDIEPGVPFDGKRHRAVETASTNDPDQDRRIRNVVRAGFQTETRLIRPADVCVLRYVALQQEETVPSDNGEE